MGEALDVLGGVIRDLAGADSQSELTSSLTALIAASLSHCAFVGARSP